MSAVILKVFSKDGRLLAEFPADGKYHETSETGRAHHFERSDVPGVFPIELVKWPSYLFCCPGDVMVDPGVLVELDRELPRPDIVIGGDEVSLQEALATQEIPLITAPTEDALKLPWEDMQAGAGEIITLPAGSVVMKMNRERGQQILWLLRHDLINLFAGYYSISNFPEDCRIEGMDTDISRDAIGLRISSASFPQSEPGQMLRSFDARFACADQ